MGHLGPERCIMGQLGSERCIMGQLGSERCIMGHAWLREVHCGAAWLRLGHYGAGFAQSGALRCVHTKRDGETRLGCNLTANQRSLQFPATRSLQCSPE